MRITNWLCRNFDRAKIGKNWTMTMNSEWNRREWEIGYRGEPIAKRARLTKTSRPAYPISAARLARYHAAFEREFEVMRCLATPYLTWEQEQPYLAKHGTVEEQLAKKQLEKEQQRMPNKPKVVTGRYKYDKWKGNIGNMLHKHSTVEDSLAYLIRRTKYE